MKKFIIFIQLLILALFFIGCTERTYYTGKILNIKDDLYNNLSFKEEVINFLGEPNFIDPIEKKFFYYNEKKITKNFFDDYISERNLIVFHFNLDNSIKSINTYNLEDENQTQFVKQQTSNELIKQGLLEKIFGGVGKEPISP
jgi:outer membrane protein assembly factor BamE (lipoprotein component of BamABCDE complex)